MRRALLITACCGMLLASPTEVQPAPEQADPPAEVVVVDEQHLELLARVIFTEACGEPFEGQVAVGAVAVNRLKDPRWPDDLREVLLAKGQFAPPTEVSDETRRAALLALQGLDPTEGAIFFYNAEIATDRWIRTRPAVCTIGSHTFAR